MVSRTDPLKRPFPRRTLPAWGQSDGKEISMKAALMAGALAVSLWGGVALADCPPSGQVSTHTQVQGQGGAGTAGSETTTVIEPAKEKPKVNNKGPEAFIGGGVEGFTGRLASVIDPGATYGATLAYKPLSWVGVEASYSGAVNNVSD